MGPLSRPGADRGLQGEPRQHHPAEGGPFAGGGAMGQAMARVDWAATSLGAVETWSASLRTVVSLCLTSRAPTMVVWGPDHVALYNDALAPLIGPKHPGALGRPYSETFAEIWEDLQGPLLRKVYEEGESVHIEDSPVFFHRSVPNEEMFWTFSWGPIRDEHGLVVGAFHPAMEVTGRVLAERRLRLLRDLAATAGQALSVRDCFARAADVLAADPVDLPFSAFYLVESERGAEVPLVARLAASRGLRRPNPLLPEEVDLVGSGFSPWPLRLAAATGLPQTVTGLELTGELLDGGPWPETPSTAVVLPVVRPDYDAPAALFVAGVSPRRPLDRALMDFLQLLAGQIATAARTARLLEQQHRVALTLQRSLLPENGRAVGLDVAARYLPGSAEAEVGGDWYDVIDLPGGCTAVVIGDVMGRGVRAAAVMGQLRAAVRAYAQLDLPPDRVLALLDRLVEEMSTGAEVGQIVTCIYAVYDPAATEIVLASAGHPPPILFSPAGSRVEEVAVGPPLGFGAYEYAATRIELPAGHGFVLYTDGLVETRDRSLDDGIDRLREAVGAVGLGDLERLADAALAAAADPEHTDDVALVAVRVPASGVRTRREVVDLRSRPRVVRVVRALVEEHLRAWGLQEPVVDSAVAVAAEIATNAVAHTPGPQQLRLRLLADRVVVEVTDTDDRPPHRLTASPSAEGGRGLLLVDALSTDWGVRPLGTGKIVWAELAVSPPAGDPQPG